MKRVKTFSKIGALALAVAGVLSLVACGKDDPAVPAGENAILSSAASLETADRIDNTEETEEEAVQTIEILVGDTTFTAQLADTEAAQQLAESLPLELDMQELNGNEKYSYLSESLTVQDSRPDSIHTGDLMLFGSDCLVLFYKDFSTSYRYTPIGNLDNPQELPAVLGRGNVTVTFRIAE